MNRTSILNYLIERYQFESYLEIGVFKPEWNFLQVICDEKIGVDPDPRMEDDTVDYGDIREVTSDIFFNGLNKDTKFDLIFIDGLHHSDQVLKDILNSLEHLSDNGIIVCHDMLPENKKMQETPQMTPVWTGDCWKAFAHLRMTREDLNMFTINTDYGVGIIKRGKQQLFKENVALDKLEYTYFTKNKVELMNVVSTNEFITNFYILMK